MSWKDFLRPDKFKIAVVVIIIAVLMLSFSTLVIGPNEQNPLYWIVIFLSTPGNLVSLYASGVYIYLGFVGILVNLVYWYILACIIVFIVRIFRKRTPKPQSPNTSL